MVKISGISPLKSFSVISNSWRFVQDHKLLGKDPVNALLAILNICNALTLAISVGNIPERLLSDAKNCSKLDKLVNDDGKLPISHTPLFAILKSFK